MSVAVDNTSKVVNAVCSLGESKIYAAITAKKQLGVTKLAEDIATELNLKSPLCYHILTLYIAQRDDIEVKMGKGGGIVFK